MDSLLSNVIEVMLDSRTWPLLHFDVSQVYFGSSDTVETEALVGRPRGRTAILWKSDVVYDVKWESSQLFISC